MNIISFNLQITVQCWWIFIGYCSAKKVALYSVLNTFYRKHRCHRLIHQCKQGRANQKTMCQSLDSSAKSIGNTVAEQHRPTDERPPAKGRCAQKAQKARFDRSTTMANQARRPDGGQTINYDCPDKRRSWTAFNWIILFSIISELFNFFSRSSTGGLNMLRFCNLNKINSSFSLFIYILITSSLINTSTIGKLSSFHFSRASNALDDPSVRTPVIAFHFLQTFWRCLIMSGSLMIHYR